MFFSGIADEASPELARQIAAHKELGWSHIELRMIAGTNLTDVSDGEFDRIAAALEDAALQVSCFSSQLANWARPIDTDFSIDIEEMKRATKRMKRLGTPFIRCMSYPNSRSPLADATWRKEAVRRLRELAAMAADARVCLVHENCDGWGGQSPQHTLDLLGDVDSPHFKLVFDTGNPVPHGQDAWKYYETVRDHVVYVHVKDYEVGDDGKAVAVQPGEGRGAVREIATDLLERGYDGGFSIEPHITSVIHLQQEASDPELAFRTYVEYGRNLERLIGSLT